MARNNGRFYFRKTLDGNLIGEFTNVDTPNICTESGDLILIKGEESFEKKQDFVGEYNTTWYIGKACSANLHISKEGDFYNLKWMGYDGVGNFEGQSMFCEKDLLTGNYWSV